MQICCYFGIGNLLVKDKTRPKIKNFQNFPKRDNLSWAKGLYYLRKARESCLGRHKGALLIRWKTSYPNQDSNPHHERQSTPRNCKPVPFFVSAYLNPNSLLVQTIIGLCDKYNQKYTMRPLQRIHIRLLYITTRLKKRTQYYNMVWMSSMRMYVLWLSHCSKFIFN